jgi:pimeloyl-ACP methyl ester carboxylesterase
MDARVEKRGSAGGPFQKVSTGVLADATLYVRSAKLREAIFRRLDASWEHFGGAADRRVVLFAHSLGCLVATDWLRLRPAVRPRALVTFGCNLELFTMGEPFDCPAQLRPGQASWTNVFYPRDALGWPLAGAPGLAHVRDVKLPWQLMRPSTWFGTAHNAYWGSEKLWAERVPHWFPTTP